MPFVFVYFICCVFVESWCCQ